MVLSKVLGGVQVRQHFRPEFINRIDDFIVFDALQRSEIASIARIQAKRVEERLAAKKIKMLLEDSAVEYLSVRASLPAAGTLLSVCLCSILAGACARCTG